MTDAESNKETAVPESGSSGYDHSLSLLVQALSKEPGPYRITVGINGLVITGRVVDENKWLELQREQDPTLGDIISKSLESSRPSSTPNARLTYLRERLRWGSGLTEEQMEELEAAEQAEARESEFLHLTHVDIRSYGGVMHLHTWRARLDRVDGYNIATESDREA